MQREQKKILKLAIMEICPVKNLKKFNIADVKNLTKSEKKKEIRNLKNRTTMRRMRIQNGKQTDNQG